MLRHSPHHTHARCGETSDFSTSIMWRNLKLLNMWRNVRFLHICHVEKYETTPHVKKFQISPHLSCIQIWSFSTWQIFLHISHLWYLWQISGMEKNIWQLPCLLTEVESSDCNYILENILRGGFAWIFFFWEAFKNMCQLSTPVFAHIDWAQRQ